jgi:hypothetical protein
MNVGQAVRTLRHVPLYITVLPNQINQERKC